MKCERERRGEWLKKDTQGGRRAEKRCEETDEGERRQAEKKDDGCKR